MEKRRLEELIKKFRSGRLSNQELRELRVYLDHPESEADLEAFFSENVNAAHPGKSPGAAHREQQFATIWSKVKADENAFTRRSNRWRTPLSGAAAALVLLAIGAYAIYQFMDLRSPQIVSDFDQSAIVPGSAQARLMLDDGRTLDLTTLPKDTVMQMGGYSIRKDERGTLTYALESNSRTVAEPLYNTIVTPTGGEYQLNLPDGSKIWVNAASTLRYRLDVYANKREVELTGEAFFQIAELNRDGYRVPFLVHTKSQHVEVLGTSFNINSYRERIETTLVEGKVQLHLPEGKRRLLTPNQQAIYDENSKKIEINPIDPFYVTAWKGGSFAFEDTPIREVMESLTRWYNVDIQYKRKVDNLKFSGTISRYENIENILQVIELTDVVKFSIEGRRITVM